MPKPSKFDKGRRLSKEEYKKQLDKYYKEKEFKDKAKQYHHVKRNTVDSVLFLKIKNTAKLKFLWPSTEAKAWVVSEYYKRGGTLKRTKDQEGQLFFNTSDATFAFNEEHIKKDKPDERKIVERRGDAKEGDLWVHPNTGNLHMKVGDKWVTVNDPNKLPKLNKQKVKKDLSVAFAERRKKKETTPKKGNY